MLSPVDPAADAAGVIALVVALEAKLYGQTAFSEADLRDEWAEYDLGRDVFVVREDGRVVGYGAARSEGEMWRVEGYVHPDAHGRGIGAALARGLEEHAVAGGARRVQNSVLERDSAARELLESLGYRDVRVFREMRIELDARPEDATWPDGLRVVPFDPERDARAVHAAHEEAFSEGWDFTPRDFEEWSEVNLASDRFDPALWCVLRDGDEIAAGTYSTGDTYGGGFVHALFTRRPWRRRGVGEALLRDAFARLWDKGERVVALGVDAANETGAFRLYERAGMRPSLGWVMYEKTLTARPTTPAAP